MMQSEAPRPVRSANLLMFFILVGWLVALSCPKHSPTPMRCCPIFHQASTERNRVEMKPGFEGMKPDFGGMKPSKDWMNCFCARTEECLIGVLPMVIRQTPA